MGAVEAAAGLGMVLAVKEAQAVEPHQVLQARSGPTERQPPEELADRRSRTLLGEEVLAGRLALLEVLEQTFLPAGAAAALQATGGGGGGATGAAVSGNSFITWVAFGTRSGPVT